MLKVYPLLFILLLVVSCSNRNVQVAKILTDFQKNEIVIPDNLIRIEKGKVLGMEPLPDRAKLIEYIDSSSCSACHIAHLEIVDNLFMMAGSTKLFDVVVVFSPRAEDASEVLRMLLAKKYKYPVYFDGSCEFAQINRTIPSDQRYHTFLIDKRGTPIFVGNPNPSDALYNIFVKSLSLL